MWVKIAIFILFGFIVLSLFRGMFYLVQDGSGSKRTVNSLTYRVIFSVALLLLLIVSASQGWIQPHTLNGKELAEQAP